MRAKKWISLAVCFAILQASIPMSGVKAEAISSENMLTRAQAECIQPASGANAAQNNYERIQYCLDTYGIAKLADGVFEVNNVIVVGNNKILTSASSNWPTIKAVAPVNSVLDIVGNNSEISFLQFDYNSQFKGEDHPCQGTIIITGSNNFIHNSFIRGADNPHRKNDLISTGVYFLNGVGNHVYNCKIYNSSYGVIFYSELEKAGSTYNRLESCEIYYNRSDGITINGYGEILNCTIHHNGYDCMNGFNGGPPIPGANIYALGNDKGAVIRGNTIYDSNGNGVDIAASSHFIIENNYIYDPGCQYFPAAEDYVNCTYGSGAGMMLADVANSKVFQNVVENHRSSNKVGDAPYPDYSTNGFFSAANAPAFSDLPNGANQVIAFILAESRDPTKHTYGNEIKDNRFRSAPNSDAVGIGYFTSRGTGFGNATTPADEWTAETTNYFTLNDPFGSHIGSVRCGGNWYASETEPNTDDDQHRPPNSDWAGNDYKSFY